MSKNNGQNGQAPEEMQIRVDVDGVMQVVHNLANIFLRTGNHEVRTAINEVARGFCFLIGLEHKVFFPDAPPIRDSAATPNAAITIPGSPGGYGWPTGMQATGRPAMPHAPQYPGIQIGINPMGMPPSPYAGYPTQNPQSDWAPDPGNPTGAKMVVVDPGPGAGMPQGMPGMPADFIQQVMAQNAALAAQVQALMAGAGGGGGNKRDPNWRRPRVGAPAVVPAAPAPAEIEAPDEDEGDAPEAG